MDHHTVAAVSLAGICLDVLGGLYLAYDLLGGRDGPLRMLTRIATYSIVFGAGYALGLGLFFGVIAGLSTGFTIAIELHRVAHHNDHYSFGWEVFFSAIRGFAFAGALYPKFGFTFAVIFGTLLVAGQAIAYARGIRPSIDYSASRRPRFTRLHLVSTLMRTVGYVAAALIARAVAHESDHAWPMALRIGLVTGLVTAVGVTVNPFIEYYADNLPERRMGEIGIWVLLCGFCLQSFQYWVAILDIPVS